MEVLGIVIGILLIAAALVITLVVLGQSSKNARHSGVIAGSAETFFGKSKGRERDLKLNKLTMIVAIVFVVLVLVMYIVQFDKARPNYGDVDAALSDAQNTTVTTTTATTTTETPSTTTETPSTTTVEGDTTTATPDAE